MFSSAVYLAGIINSLPAAPTLLLLLLPAGAQYAWVNDQAAETEFTQPPNAVVLPG